MRRVVSLVAGALVLWPSGALADEPIRVEVGGQYAECVSLDYWYLEIDMVGLTPRVDHGGSLGGEVDPAGCPR